MRLFEVLNQGLLGNLLIQVLNRSVCVLVLQALLALLSFS